MRREIGPKHRNVDRRRHGVVVALRGVDRAGLNGTEQLTLRHKLVGRVKFDHHFAIGSLVERVNRGLDDVLGKGRACIGLQPPFDRALCPDVRRCKCACPKAPTDVSPAFLRKSRLLSLLFSFMPILPLLFEFTLYLFRSGHWGSCYRLCAFSRNCRHRPVYQLGNHIAISGKIIRMMMVSTMRKKNGTIDR